MKVIITGANGQVGWELQRTMPEGVQCIALQKAEFDITDHDIVTRRIVSEQPDWVINAAAYTAVDKAEQEQDLAYRINRDGAANIAQACKEAGAKMLQISTDFVFDGKQSTPYLTTSKPNPLSVYGTSKQAGDEAVRHQLGDNCAIVRTSWVYSAHGNNFVKTMLRLMSERDDLGIVSDQVGTPTWANGLARAIWTMVTDNITGLYHWSDYGVASWYDFAIAIFEEASALGILDTECAINPIRTEQYPTPATRPHYCVLDKSTTVATLNHKPEYWRDALRHMLQDLNNTH
jgi:dTDP-4-dehydrorhamnose reductase